MNSVSNIEKTCKYAIGGYFGLEIASKPKPRRENSQAVYLNTARNALEYILTSFKGIQRLYVPSYICSVVLQPLKRKGIDIVFYNMNDSFEPIITDKLSKESGLLVVNYFGICEEVLSSILNRFSEQIIIDCSQSFYYSPPRNTPAFYSPRKFFGVPDGGIAKNVPVNNLSLDRDKSYNRCMHLLQRLDTHPEDGYADFLKNEEQLNGLPLKYMSNLTSTILDSVDFDSYAEKRRLNYSFLNKEIGHYNELRIKTTAEMVPMVYPLLIQQGSSLREYLRQNRVYCAKYWPKVAAPQNMNEFEKHLCENLVPLPIDPRYDLACMEKVLSYVNAWHKNG